MLTTSRQQEPDLSESLPQEPFVISFVEYVAGWEINIGTRQERDESIQFVAIREWMQNDGSRHYSPIESSSLPGLLQALNRELSVLDPDSVLLLSPQETEAIEARIPLHEWR